ncbi:flagella locus protein FlaG [Shewanella sp. M-Br]|jgi:flagellar protein FlaG|nr:flagella locus protein FlaG [Shewanella sp. M-Br]
MMDINSVSTSNVVGLKTELKLAPPQSLQQESSGSIKPLLGQSNSVNMVEDGESTKDTKTNVEQLDKVASDLTDMVTMMRKGLAFKVDASSDRPVVSVMDIDSGEVLRQIPSEEALALAEKLSEVTGALIKTEV